MGTYCKFGTASLLHRLLSINKDHGKLLMSHLTPLQHSCAEHCLTGEGPVVRANATASPGVSPRSRARNLQCCIASQPPPHAFGVPRQTWTRLTCNIVFIEVSHRSSSSHWTLRLLKDVKWLAGRPGQCRRCSPCSVVPGNLRQVNALQSLFAVSDFCSGIAREKLGAELGASSGRITCKGTVHLARPWPKGGSDR